MPLFLGYRNSFEFKYKITHARKLRWINRRDTISSLIDNGFLAKAITYSYDVGLTSLKVGINGDYTVKSSDDLYTNMAMQEKLHAYGEIIR
jgi:hypothetical protein